MAKPEKKKPVKGLLKSLSKFFTPKELSKKTKVTTQKLSGAKRTGVADVKLRVKLEKVLERERQKEARRNQKKQAIKQADKIYKEFKSGKESAPVMGRAGEIYFEDHKALIKEVPHAKIVKTLPSKKQAVEWWKRIGGGSVYFVISSAKSKKSGQTLYYVSDIRTKRELSRKVKGNLDGVARARVLIESMLSGNDSDD